MSIRLEQVSKSYANGAAAVSDVSVDIGDAEFFVLLGPSGSGKTTLLRAIAGLASVDHGRIELHGRDVTNVSAREREVGFVFQNYALFQHMTVGENIEFALRARRVPAARRRLRRQKLLELVSLEGMDERYPRQLSGGQQQRVAVARALAHEPRVLLLDEPFGALDAKIREELRRAIRRIQRSIGITAILVTHDQEEAFTLADRIGVMDRGRLQEVGEPRLLYRQPSTRFVATFLGAANLLLGTLGRGTVQLGESRLPFTGRVHSLRPGDEATVVVRPEDVELAACREGLRAPAIGTATIAETQFSGSVERLKLEMSATASIASALRPASASFLIDAARDTGKVGQARASAGQRVWVGIRNLHVLPTPISSIRLLAASEPAATTLALAPLVRELSVRMQIEPLRDFPATVAPQRGLPVVGIKGPQDLAAITDLFARGARQVLALPPVSDSIDRMLICTDPIAAARDSALAAAASIARHLDVDAAMSLRCSNFPRRAARYKELLDLRNESLRRHGIDIRTESYTGTLADAIAAAGTSAQHTLLVIGLNSPTGDSRLYRDLRHWLTTSLPAGLLLVIARSPQPIHRAADTSYLAAAAH